MRRVVGRLAMRTSTELHQDFIKTTNTPPTANVFADQAIALSNRTFTIMERIIANMEQEKKEAIAQAIADKKEAIAQAIADKKEAIALVVASKNETIEECRQGWIVANAQLAAARGTLSRRAAYELVLQCIYSARKASDPTMKGKFIATETERWLIDNAATLVLTYPPGHTLFEAATCANNHIRVDPSTLKLTDIGLYGHLSKDIHGTGLDMDHLKRKPDDSKITESMHGFFVCLIQTVLHF